MTDTFMERLILIFCIAIVLGTVWSAADAMITLQSIDLVKVIGR